MVVLTLLQSASFRPKQNGGGMQRLNIVVPYRAREQHLELFVPHVRACFARDLGASKIPYRVTIVEQENGLPFNRGAVKNIGFLLGREHSDYTVFHDIDFLPIWADYSYAETLTPLAWYGAEARPIIPGRPELAINVLSAFFGGVVLAPNALFKRVNGYSNLYWGWGFEDIDLGQRIKRSGKTIGRRKGTFQQLPHANEGIQLDLKPTPVAEANYDLYLKKWRDGLMPAKDDGLSSIDFSVLNRRQIPEVQVPERPAPWEIVTVRLNMQPRAEQLAACGKSSAIR
jgi:hypothetical protein